MIVITPYSVNFDGIAHTATGTATGLGGVNLSSDLILSGTTHTQVGAYNGDVLEIPRPLRRLHGRPGHGQR